MIIPLTGCTKLPKNDYFENTTIDPHDDALDLFKSYGKEIAEYLDETYPSFNSDYDIIDDENYYVVNKYKREYLRHELINYNLTEQRDYLRFSDLWYVTTELEQAYSFGLRDCYDLTEGETCTSLYVEDYKLEFQKEGSDILFVFSHKRSGIEINVEFYFYKVGNRLGLELTYKELNTDTNEYSKISNTKYLEGEYEESHSYELVAVDAENEIHIASSYYNIATNDFYQLKQSSSSNVYSYFSGEAKEYYRLTQQTDSVVDMFTNFTYIEYSNDKKLVQYSDFGKYYWVNLSEIEGWDRLVKDTISSFYDVFYGDDLLPGLRANVEFNNGEFVYFEYEDLTERAPNEVLSLSIFNLEAKYNQSYFSEKEVYMIEQYLGIMSSIGFTNTYEENLQEIVDLVE
jgi:hypothetical protein